MLTSPGSEGRASARFGKLQICLAHLLCDTRFAIDCGDAIFAIPLNRLPLRAIAIGRRRPELKGATLARYRYDLDRRLDGFMATQPTNRNGEKLRRRIALKTPLATAPGWAIIADAMAWRLPFVPHGPS